MNCGSPFLREISRMTSSSRPGRHGVGFDVRDEAVPVLLADQGFERGSFVRVAGHGLPSVPTRATRAPAASAARWSRCRAPVPASCASEMSVSARRIAPFTRCQAWPTRQFDSMPQLLCWPLHSVIANGPSSASRMRAARDLAGRAGQLIAAVAAARGDHQAAALQLLQQLAHGRQADAACARPLRRRSTAGPAARPGRPGSRCRSRSAC